MDEIRAINNRILDVNLSANTISSIEIDVETRRKYIEKMIQTNLIAPMLLTRLVLPERLNRKRGHVVTLSSLGGKRVIKIKRPINRQRREKK